MALNFPNPPLTVGQTYSGYVWDGEKWMATVSSGSGSGAHTISSTPPASPAVGDLWTDSDTLVTYMWYNDGSSSQWVSVGSSGGGDFIQAGAGAVTRTMQNKVREHVSVKDFGAVGNGLVDDAWAIRAAMSAVNAAGGGSVYIPAGTYLLATFDPTNALRFINPYSNITLYGDGDSSLLKVAGGNNPVPGQTWGFFIMLRSAPDRIVNFQLRNFACDMNGASNQSTGPRGYENSLLELIVCDNIVVENCCVKNSGGSQPIVLAGGSGYVVRNNRFVNVGKNVDPMCVDH